MTNADLAIALMEVAIGAAGLALGYIVGLHQGQRGGCVMRAPLLFAGLLLWAGWNARSLLTTAIRAAPMAATQGRTASPTGSLCVRQKPPWVSLAFVALRITTVMTWSFALTAWQRCFSSPIATSAEGISAMKYNYSTAEGQKRLMAESTGLPSDTYTRRTIDLSPGDYGADPVGDGTFRMVPSGDIVSAEERAVRLAARRKA